MESVKIQLLLALHRKHVLNNFSFSERSAAW